MKIPQARLKEIIKEEIGDLEARLGGLGASEDEAATKVVKRGVRDELRALANIFKGMVDVFNAVKRAHKRAEEAGHTINFEGMRLSPHGIDPVQIKRVLDLSKIIEDVADSIAKDNEDAAAAAEPLAEALSYLTDRIRALQQAVEVFDTWEPLGPGEVEGSYAGPWSRKLHADPREEYKAAAHDANRLYSYLYLNGIPDIIRGPGAKYIPKPLRNHLFDLVYNKDSWLMKGMGYTSSWEKYTPHRGSSKTTPGAAYYPEGKLEQLKDIIQEELNKTLNNEE